MSNYISGLLDILFDAIFVPKTVTPNTGSAPVEPISQLPAVTPLTTAVSALILGVNHEWPYPPSGVWTSPLSKSTIHKIEKADADIIAGSVIAACSQYGVPVPYLLACIAVESVFDPKCDNPNTSWIGHTGSNPANDPEGHDVGVCQIKIVFLMEDQKLTLAQAQAFALNPQRAIPHMAKTMATLLADADQEIALIKGQSSILPRFHNRFYVATGMYNFGVTGMDDQIPLDKIDPAHCDQVLEREQAYCKTLNLPSVFADVTG